MKKESFENVEEKQGSSLFLLKNSAGTELYITNYGARIVALIVKDKDGEKRDVVLGYDSLEKYLKSTESFHGAIVGRYANRIAYGRFELEGKTYQLPVNLPPHHLHGGKKGFHDQVWEMKSVEDHTITLYHYSPDGSEGYPGNLEVWVDYHLSDENEITISYRAISDQTTVINLTAHPYFNLNGQGSGTAMNHRLQILADHYTPVDETIIPHEVEKVDGSPFDFREERIISDLLDSEDPQLKLANGYDHNFVLNGDGFRKAAVVVGDRSGIRMEVSTDQPGLQFYTANYLQSENILKGGLPDERRSAVCFESQHFPDSPNHPSFPSTVLKPGGEYKTKTSYQFFV